MFKRKNTVSYPNGRVQAKANSALSPVDGNAIPQPQQDALLSSEYARKCKKFLDLDKSLKDLGAERYFDMPRITVIGGQSAGKSSLVEAVSGINVPRDAGTCTRCPMECTMSSSASPWSCQIKLRFSVDGDGNNLGVTPQPVPFGPVITDKKQVELWIRRAQAAILSPHRQMDDLLFHTKSLSDLRDAIESDPKMLPFSKNAVQVEIRDPELTDLSFIDLPGLIQNSDQDIIDLVRDLVAEHIKGENTLILVTMPMSDDIENQQAARLAAAVDPHGERTIGVLTKPDILTQGASGAQKRWKDIITGNDPRHNLKHGYYCVRLPDDEERRRALSRAGSLRAATDFFDNTPPWSGMLDRSRFGVPNLVVDLSRLLVNLIENNLPKLKLKIDELLHECEVGLSEIPPLPQGDPSIEILTRINKFCTQFQAATFGEGQKSLVQANRRRYKEFKQAIYETCPDFRPFIDHTVNAVPTLQGPSHYSRPPMDLTMVQDVIANSIGWELPGHVPFDATARLIRDFTSLWKEPSLSCFEDVFDESSNFVDELVERHFGQFWLLHAHISSETRKELDDRNSETLRALEKILTLESVPAFTQNIDYLRSEEKSWSSSYSAIYHQPHIWRQHPTDNDEINDALVVMAKVRAYFQVAYKRVIDYIPLVIEHELNQTLANNFENRLLKSLFERPDASDAMKALLSEEPALSMKRASLEERRARLTEIKQRLDNFQEDTVIEYRA